MKALRFSVSVKPNILRNWKKRYVALQRKIFEWGLRERAVVYFGITKGFGGIAGDVGHLDSNLTRRTLFGSFINLEQRIAIHNSSLITMQLEDLEDECIRAGISKDEIKRAALPIPSWEKDFHDSMIAGRIFNPFEYIDKKSALRLKRYLEGMVLTFRARDLMYRTKAETIQHLLKGIPNSSRREAESLWRAAVALNPRLAKRSSAQLPSRPPAFRSALKKKR